MQLFNCKMETKSDMKNMTIWNIARACKGHLAVPAGKHTGTCPAAGMAVIRGYSGKEAAGIVIDSRKVEPGDIFVAIRGERVDGHQFIREVFDKGAIAVVCEEEPEELPGPCIRVEDSLAALRQIAALYREQMPIPIVGITGSVGKTSTKEMIASVLAQKYNVHKTQGNFNNELGRIEKTIDESIHNAAYSEINLYYNHYNSSTSFEFKKLNLFPLKFEGEYYSNKDFVIETDITSMIYSLLTFYIMYQLRMCECISRAAENTIRNQITREAIDKIEQIEEEQSNELRKEKKTILINKTVDNYKKLSYMEADNG